MQSDEEVGKVAQAVPIIIYILFQKNKHTHKYICVNALQSKEHSMREYV